MAEARATLPGGLALGGDTIARADGATVSIHRGGREVARFDVASPAGWMEIAPDESALLMSDRTGSVAWIRREGRGVQELATATGRGDAFACGFATLDGEVVTLLAQSGRIAALASDGREVFAADLSSPRPFHTRRLVSLPGDRLALFGHEFSDTLDTVVTVSVADLARDPLAFQDALQRRLPVCDRAVRITIGPCAPGAAVVFRDPEDEEVPTDDEDVEELGDVGNFTGLYVRELDGGALVERIAYAGRDAVSGVRLTATARVIAIGVTGGLDVVTRGTGAVQRVRARSLVLDVCAARVAMVRDGGVEIFSIDALPDDG